MKRYIIYAGVNGAGKTTLFQSSNELRNLPFVNMDYIVRDLGNWKKPEDVLLGGKKAASLIRRYLSGGETFCQESTLCGKSILRNIKFANATGYSVEIYYVGLASPELAKERVAYRVKEGGHGIPEKDIERRYYESIANLIAILPLCDLIELYDNTDSFRQIAVVRHGICTDKVDLIPEWCQTILDNTEKGTSA